MIESSYPTATPLGEESPWLRPEKAGTIGKKSGRTIRRWVEQDKLPAHRFGARDLRIHVADLAAYLSTPDDAPACRLCGRSRRWNKARGEWALYCSGMSCSAPTRICEVCGTSFKTADPEAKGRTCSEACRAKRRRTYANPASTPWTVAELRIALERDRQGRWALSSRQAADRIGRTPKAVRNQRERSLHHFGGL